jgi:hypothetical protein
MKAFRGVIDGKSIDSGTLYAHVKLDSRFNDAGKNFKGGEGLEAWKCPSAEIVFRLQHLPFPFLVRLETERVSNGTDSTEIVLGAVPIERPAAVHSAGVVRQVQKAA